MHFDIGESQAKSIESLTVNRTPIFQKKVAQTVKGEHVQQQEEKTAKNISANSIKPEAKLNEGTPKNESVQTVSDTLVDRAVATTLGVATHQQVLIAMAVNVAKLIFVLRSRAKCKRSKMCPRPS